MAVAVPRDAATVVVVRDGDGGPEVLLLQRAERGDHNSGAWVFPGGLVDPGDRKDTARAFQHAALRECFEECGILLARNKAGDWPVLDDGTRTQMAALRTEVAAGAVSIEEVCGRFALEPAFDTLHFIGHWLTPMGRAKRFDTRFFVAVVPRGQEALHDAQETMDHVWITPARALAPDNARRLMTPTRATLEQLLPFADTEAIERWAAQPRTVQRILPRLAVDSSGVRPVQPGEAAYDEVEKLDPEGRCDASCELTPGVEVRLGEHVVRVVREDGSNRYLVDGIEVPVGTPRLVAEDRIVIARDARDVPPAVRDGADWVAPERGFLKRLV